MSAAEFEARRRSPSPEVSQSSSDNDVSTHQDFWVFNGPGTSAKKATEWTNPCTGSVEGQPVSLRVELDQAPATFNSPCRLKKVFHPPFALRVVATCAGNADFTCKARCYLLTDQQFENVAYWDPDIHGEEALVADGVVEGHVSGAAPGEGAVYKASAKLVFTDLKFVQPSRMSKRYALFHVETSFGAVVWVVYTKPTLVVSRSIDQYNKAVLILQDIQPMDGRRMRGKGNLTGGAAAAHAATEAAVLALKKRNAPHQGADEGGSLYFTPSMATDYLNASFSEAGIARPLSDTDITFLLLTAGFYPAPQAHGAAPEVQLQFQAISEVQWEAFSTWFESEVLPAITAVQQLWDQCSPQAICPLSTTREISEEVLKRAPAGTFCVRVRLKLGNAPSWVISCGSSSPGGPVQHILLTQKHLELHSLEVWVRDLQHLVYCVDITNGKLVHKEYLFLKNYLRMDKPDGTADEAVSPSDALAAGSSIPAKEIQDLMGPSYTPNAPPMLGMDSQQQGLTSGSIDLSNLLLDVDLGFLG